MWKTIGAKEVFRATFIDQARDGSLFYLEQSITPVLGSDGSITHYVSEGKDITERVRRERELKRVATTDWLTGLANRGRFEHMLDKEFERGRRYQHGLALIMFDVDYFKDVNDRYGHEIGDEILKLMAGAVAKVLRDTDEIGRWGGEEFMILAPETGTEGGRSLAERIREVIADTECPGPGHITASFGVTARKPDDTPRDITRRVDDALYEAKKKGRNLTEIA